MDRMALLPAPLRAAFERLGSSRATERLAGLDALFGAIALRGPLAAESFDAIPAIVTLACSPIYPGASAVLLRLGHLVAHIDDPPRSLALDRRSDAAPTGAHRMYDAVEAERSQLLSVVRRSSDPEAARIAACLCAHFPRADEALEPLLVALLGGASDSDARTRLLYALTRVQASRAVPFHRRIAEAMQAPALDADRLAIALALVEHAPPEPTRARARESLEAALDADAATASEPPPAASGPDADAPESSESHAFEASGSDPSAFGRTLTGARLRSALERLAGT